jgi:hypothetical protein
MKHTATLGARIGVGLIGGLIGIAVGNVLGMIVGDEFGSQESALIGRFVGMGIGLLGGAFVGAFLVGRPSVAGWCLGTVLAVGTVSFLAGFVGPTVFTPDSNQGPLLGILITGPLGFVIGAVVGLVIGLVRNGVNQTTTVES